jgi:maltooligosyltrehalose trehalohydrolase
VNPSMRRFPIGAEVFRGKGTHLRVWAPARTKVEVARRELGSRAAGECHALTKEKDGYFSGFVPGMDVGALYSFRLDADGADYPDPASRFQPEGPHGPSMVVDPSEYRWSDAGFTGADNRGQVLYEMHIGTFTKVGTYEAAAAELPELHELGITTRRLFPGASAGAMTVSTCGRRLASMAAPKSCVVSSTERTSVSCA